MDIKNKKVIESFNLIAPAYDIASDTVTLGLHRLWRRSLCRKALKHSPKNAKILDLATGTGDVIIGLLSIRSDIHVTGVDASHGMLQMAEKKIMRKAKLFTNEIELKLANSLHLPFPNNFFHTVTLCWGLRNMHPRSAVLKEILRVLKPNGHVIILESGIPDFKFLRTFYKKCNNFLPIISEKIGQLKPIYSSHTSSLENFPSGSAFTAEMYEAGFMKAKYKTLGVSFVYLYNAQKPSY